MISLLKNTINCTIARIQHTRQDNAASVGIIFIRSGKAGSTTIQAALNCDD
jgi:hypothetical protein